jgi:hypothetical protein
MHDEYAAIYQTSMVAVPVTNLVAKPEAEGTIQAAGSVATPLLPGTARCGTGSSR